MMMDGLGVYSFIGFKNPCWTMTLYRSQSCSDHIFSIKSCFPSRSKALHFIDANDDPLNHECSVVDSRDCLGDCIFTG